MPNILIWESLSILAGGQKVALQILDALNKNYKCIFLIPEEGPLTTELKKRNINYYKLDIGQYTIGKKTLFDIIKYLIKTPEIFLRAYKIIKKEEVRLIYVNAARNFLWSALLGNIMSISVIWHIHNYFHDNKSKYIIKKIGKFKSVKKIVFVADSVKQHFPTLNPKSIVIHNGIDIGKFLSSNIKKSNIRREFGIHNFKKIIVTIGWIMPTKRQEILLRAIPLVLKQIKDVHFLFVGGKRAGYESYFEKLLCMTNKLGIKDYVTFTGHRHDIPEIMNIAFINVITSEEAFPLTLLEGWASGVPTVGPDFGSIPELIKDRKTGLIYDHKSPDDLSEKILILLKDKRQYEKIRKFSLSISKRFDIQRFKKDINNLVREVLSK